MPNAQVNQSDETTALSTLRDEIVRTQDTRADLMKWKLALVGGIGAIGLGFAGSGGTHAGADLVLCAIPLVCLYVDSFCAHLSIRILLIGRFIGTRKSSANTFVAYEQCVYTVRHGPHGNADTVRHGRHRIVRRVAPPSPFVFEGLALEGATIVLSIFVILFPIVIRKTEPTDWLFYLSGSLGLVLATGGWLLRGVPLTRIDETVSKC